MKNNKGQNVVEYILVAVAVVLVCLVLLNPQSGPVKKSVETTLNSTVDSINSIANTIQFQ
ncbi:MAG: hypothetical protein HY209_03890 [Candidatus Omnitrophica bacterium]|nr:hypothetical protein [Candidatus Omnitrophota bacterium]